MCHLGFDEMEVVCGFDMSFSLGWMSFSFEIKEENHKNPDNMYSHR